MLRLHFRGRAVGFCAGFLVFGLLPQAINAQADQAARVRGLDNDLLRLHGEASQNPPAQTVAQRSQAAQVIGQRAEALRNLIQQDPRQALSLAFSADTLAQLAATFPAAASQLESHRILQGSVERWIADSADLKSSATVIRMKSGAQILDLYFSGPEPVGLTSGSILEATGVQVGATVAVTSSTLLSPAAVTSTGAMSPLGAASTNNTATITTGLSCSTTGVQNTAVILATWAGATVSPTVTPQSIQDAFFGTGGHSLDGFWREASYGKTSATGDVFGWYTLSQPYTCNTGSLMRDEAIAMAAAQGVNFQNYTRVFVIYPNVGCTAGFAQVGCSTLSTPSGSITASSAYIEADYMAGDQGVELATHEGGHNLGLQHAGTLGFGTEALGPLGAIGTVNEFGDYWSTMSQNLGIYPAQQKAEILNWLDPGTNYQVVQGSGTWSLQPLETNPAGLQALKIQRGTGNNAWLWVEYRQPLGNYDSTLMTDPFSGALIHYEDPTTGAFTHLLDFTPDGSWNTWWSPALAAGSTWVDPYTNLSISVQSATANALTVAVNYTGPVCKHANPTVSASPLNPSTTAGKSVGYNIMVTNNDSAACSAGTFSLASSQPSGWSTFFSTTSLTLSPGQSGTVTMTKNVPANVLAGVYAVDSSATDGTSTASGLASVTVTAPPVVTVGLSTPSSTYTVRQTATLTATVLYGAAPAAGASVKFTMSIPGGGISTKSVTTDSTGKAAWSYKIGGKGPLGAYSVTASATYNAQTAPSNTTSFTVK